MAKKSSGSGTSQPAPDPISKIINVRQEAPDEVQEIADSNGVAMIAFMSPFTSVRVGPAQSRTTSIGLVEEFGVEDVVEKLDAANIKKAYLLVNSPGGVLSSSYKIARVLRQHLDEIITFVPYVAASGGALLAMAGNKIVMGPMSAFSPLDAQIPYENTRLSSSVAMKFLARSRHWFETSTVDETPYPFQALVDKMDPYIFEELCGAANTGRQYVIEILKGAGNTRAEAIADELVFAYPMHEYVIGADEAARLGLPVEGFTGYLKEWQVMRRWLRQYLLTEATSHCIRYALPGAGGAAPRRRAGKKKKTAKAAAKKRPSKKRGSKKR